MELPQTFRGTHADVLVTLIFRCVQNGGNHLVPLFTTLLTTFLNLTPYIKVAPHATLGVLSRLFTTEATY